MKKESKDEPLYYVVIGEEYDNHGELLKRGDIFKTTKKNRNFLTLNRNVTRISDYQVERLGREGKLPK